MDKGSKDKYHKTLLEIRDFEAKMRTKFRELLEKHGVHPLRLSDVLNEVNRGLHDEVVFGVLRKAFEVPFESILETLQRLDRDSSELEEKKRFEEECQKHRESIAQDNQGFDNKFLRAFERLLIDIHKLREDEEEAIHLLGWACAEVKKSVRDGVKVYERVREKIQPLSNAISKVERALQHDEPDNDAIYALMEELDGELKPFQELFGAFRASQARHASALEQRDVMFQQVNEFDRKESILQGKLETAEEWADEMGLNPFLALHKDRKSISRENSKIPDCRAFLRAELPQLPEAQAAEKILEIAEELMGRMEEMHARRQERKEVLPRLTVISGGAEEKKVEAAHPEPPFKIEITAPMKLSPKQFAVCVFGAFCTDKTLLGRTAEIVHRDFLEAHGLTFGYSLEDFRQGLLEARDEGLMVCRQMGIGKRRNDVWKPAERGLEEARNWLGRLPVSKKDFIALMRFMHEEKKQAQRAFAKKVSRKRH